jgi:integrase
MSQKIVSYVEEVSKQNRRTARVVKSHLGDFDRFNDNKTDEVIELCKTGKTNVYDLLKAYTGRLLDKGTLSAKTIAYAVKTARRFLEFSDVEISTSKFRLKVKLPKAIRTQKAALARTDVVKIINALPDMRLKTYIMFLASSGCRAEEGLSITLADINFHKDPATLHIDGNFTKTRTDRNFWLTSEMKGQLQDWIAYKYRKRTIKSKNEKGEWVERELEPQQHPDDFVFLPYGNRKPEDLKIMENLHFAQRILKNAYHTLYEPFRAAVLRTGYPKVTFHSFRRFAYTTIDGLGHNQFAEFWIGHSNSPYWSKPEAEKIKTFKQIEQYLTFIDIAGMEAHAADTKSQIESLTAENQRLSRELEESGKVRDMRIGKYEWAIIDLQRKVEELAKKK